MNELEPRQQMTIHPQYELLILGVVLFQLGNSILLSFTGDPDIRQIGWIFFYFFSVVLLIDFIVRLIQAKSRSGFFFRRHGWLCLVGSLPIPWLALARLAWTLLTVRYLRMADLGEASAVIVRQRAQSAIVAVVLLSVLVLETASIGVLHYEVQSPEANIRSGQDALWWSYVTIATVGYGDRYPVTPQGRIVGILTMTVGVALFTVLTGFLVDQFRAPRRKGQQMRSRLPPDGTSAKLDEIRELLDEQEKAHSEALAAIRARLEEIEQSTK
jgi:voltage-gated potassium channel